MRTIVAAALIGVVGVMTPPESFAQARPGPTASADERELLRLEDAWAEALIKRDATFFRRTLHPRYVYSDERGVFTREQVIAEQTAGTDTVRHAANEGMRVHLYGPAAVVTGILVVRGTGKDGAFEHRYRYTDSWARTGGRWRMIASQDYDIPRR
jgi:hypothetical protein